MKSKLSLLLGLTFLHLANSAQAQVELELSRAPLFVRPPVPANIVLTFDDSGSMSRAYTPNEVIGTFLPNTAAVCYFRDFPHFYAGAANTQYFDPSVVYSPPVYVNGNAYPDAVFTAAYLDGYNAHRTGTELVTSPKRDLSEKYVVSVDGAGTNNLISFGTPLDTNCGGGGNRVYPGPDANAVRRAFYFTFNNTNPINPLTGLPGKPTVAQLFGNAGNGYNATSYTFASVTAAQETNFANWYSYYRTRNLTGRTAALRAFSQLPQQIRVAWQGINGDQLTNTFQIKKIADTAHRTAFFDYLDSVPISGGTPSRAATVRVGNYFSDNNASGFSESNPYFDTDLDAVIGPANANSVLSCRQNYHLLFTDGGWNGNGGQFENQNADQTAATLPIPYVISPTPTPTARTFPMAPHTQVYAGGPNQNNKGGFADVAFRFWAQDLQPNLRNNVVPFLDDRTIGVTGPVGPLPADPFENDEIYWNPRNDPATWQHLVQFVVAFGLTSTLDFPGDLTALRTGAKDWTFWGSNETSDPNTKVDDSWHAAINSRGELLNANNPQELVQQLNAVFQSIANRTASISQASVSSSLLTTTALAYRTFFGASSWSGAVRATRFNADGTETVVWDSSCKLSGGSCPSITGNPSFPARTPASRTIYTLSGATKTLFEWANLSLAQQTQLNFNYDNAALDGKGADRVAFIRGDRSQEGGSFRSRDSVLGAIVSSSAVFVAGAVDSYYTENQNALDPLQFPTAVTPIAASGPENKANFRIFANSVRNRPETVYVGANDGMVHAFDAQTGDERWAYVPAAMYRQLSRYTSRSSLFFQAGVDSTPQVREIYSTSSGWKTILVSSMRGGAQAVIALDITDPSPSVAPAQRVLWEFSDSSPNGADLGYTFGIPTITRLRNGKWVVLVPGGYNSKDPRNPVTGATGFDTNIGSGNAVLFVLDAADGTVLKKFDLGAGTSGLGSVTAGDYIFGAGVPSSPVGFRSGSSTVDPLNRTRDQVTDVAFAGDDFGGVWRFNFESASPATWAVRKFFTLPAGSRLTASPKIAGSGGFAVVGFGTGRYVTNADRGDTNVQSIYGVYDNGPLGTAALSQANLLQQGLTVTGTGASRQIRTGTAPVGPNQYGWFFQLAGSGERVLAPAVLIPVNNSFIMSSFTPTADPTAANDPCRDESLSSFYILNVLNGGPASVGGVAAFDTNGDGVINSLDDATLSGFSITGFIGGVTSVLTAGGGGAIVLPNDAGAGGGAGGNAAGSNGSTRRNFATPQWRRVNSRELPSWDQNERN